MSCIWTGDYYLQPPSDSRSITTLQSIYLKMSITQKMESDLESVLGSLVTPTPTISPHEAAERIYTLGNDYIHARSFAGSLADDEEDDAESYGGPTTPGVPHFFWRLWSTLVDYVHYAPVEEQAHDDRITRVVDFISQIKAKSQPKGEDWLLGSIKCRWGELPLLGPEIRAVCNNIESGFFDPSRSLLSQEAQAAVAGAVQLEPQQLTSEGTQSDVIRLAKCRHQWLSLQVFISRLWRDCGCDGYEMSAIWALRPALEDWPESPPACDTKFKTFEESPAYLAFQVEAASIWICNTAPLMYRCTIIMGPNGAPDWRVETHGAPGRGGRRWNGVDGYDREHKRWQLWKDVLGEVVQWCDRVGKDEMKGRKVKDAAIRALEALKTAERH
ncbi:unnamed protein product [Rhizoctonia solani]|uniref:DUF3632 family protein n=2 Tax=Rhizoctonia solani TaxID=456999 RepID=A0A8H3HBL9_9AGAM|nr:unnamed protein product [Rhizoctonia solani]CAE6498443.1 unnamed protein product [Rhizoctonia solani]